MFEGMSVEAEPAPASQPSAPAVSPQEGSGARHAAAAAAADLGGVFCGLDLAGADDPAPGDDGDAADQQLLAAEGDIFAGMDTGFEDIGFTAVAPDSLAAAAPDTGGAARDAAAGGLLHTGSGAAVPLSPARSDEAAPDHGAPDYGGEKLLSCWSPPCSVAGLLRDSCKRFPLASSVHYRSLLEGGT